MVKLGRGPGMSPGPFAFVVQVANRVARRGIAAPGPFRTVRLAQYWQLGLPIGEMRIGHARGMLSARFAPGPAMRGVINGGNRPPMPPEHVAA